MAKIRVEAHDSNHPLGDHHVFRDGEWIGTLRIVRGRWYLAGYDDEVLPFYGSHASAALFVKSTNTASTAA